MNNWKTTKKLLRMFREDSCTQKPQRNDMAKSIKSLLIKLYNVCNIKMLKINVRIFIKFIMYMESHYIVYILSLLKHAIYILLLNY